MTIGTPTLDSNHFQALLEAAPDAIVIADQTGAIVLVNAQTERVFGHARETLLGKPVEMLMPPRFRTRHIEHRGEYFREARTRPMGANTELLGLHRDGREFPVEVSLSPLRTEQGMLVISAIRDVTGYRAAEKEAREANRIKDEFLATLSHELRTPLSAILGWSSMLNAGIPTAGGVPAAIQSIARSARQLAQLVDDLLDVSRIITGSLRLNVDSVALAPVIEAAVDTIRPAVEAKGIQLRTVLDRSDVVVAGDSTRLQQIVWNLLANAVKFTPKGGSIQVTLERVGSQAQIVVSDTGRGIAAEFLPFVFDRFRQADSTTTRTIGGLGLGLAIVRHLVDLHGGNVQAYSAGENAGATFTVALPIRVVSQDRRKPPILAAEAPMPPLPFDIPDLTGIRVLIVDDDAETRELLRAMVGQTGAETLMASSVAEAMLILDDGAPDLVISDIGMPENDGYALIRNLRSRPAAAGGRIPAVALTAYARVEDRRRSLLAGFQSHLAKPAEPSELLALIAALVGRTGASALS